MCRVDEASFFIDRDGDLFSLVLDYLRNGKLLLPNNFKEVARLKEEALFYQTGGLVQQLAPYYNLKYPIKNGHTAVFGNGMAGNGVLETGQFNLFVLNGKWQEKT